MPYSELLYWSQYVGIIEAREQLRKFEASSYPNMKRDGMKKVRDRYYKIAVPCELDDSKIHTTAELAKFFKDKK